MLIEWFSHLILLIAIMQTRMEQFLNAFVFIYTFTVNIK